MKKALLIVGVIGMVLSFCVVGSSVGLHLMNPRNISLDEAMWGIVPGSLCCSLFFIVAVVGLILMLMTPSAETSRKKKRRDEGHGGTDDDDQ